MKNANPLHIIPTGEATGLLPVDGGNLKPVTVIGTETIRNGFEATCLTQALNARRAPGVSELVINPDAHAGYGAPIGCVMVSPSHIYPGPIGVDVKCSMSLLRLDLPAEAMDERPIRRALIDAITARIPTGAGKGQRSVPKGRRYDLATATRAILEGATKEVCEALGIPPKWAARCEDASHVGHDPRAGSLRDRLDRILRESDARKFDEKLFQIGSYGGGNHFGECNVTRHVGDDVTLGIAESFGIRDGGVTFLSHTGSRGFGNRVAHAQFERLGSFFDTWGIPFPGDDRYLVYAPLGTPEADDYLDDIALAGNFATVNHLLINALALEAFAEVIPGVTGDLVYMISHNFVRREVVDGRPQWVHRKGATRAFPAWHHALRGTPFEETGHPILLPGDPQSGSAVMVALPGAEKSCFSINHGAGRALGRREAGRRLKQAAVDASFAERDILTNCRNYPVDEAPSVYKDFGEVLSSVEKAGLARPVAMLKARFVIKDSE